jgi:HD-GYP domain-containing protein (c-di-GMP phosphodiesterase class II)
MRLLRPVYGLRGQLLLNRGVELTSSYIEALKRYNVLAVSIASMPGLDDIIEENALEERIRVQAMLSITRWAESRRRKAEFPSVIETVDQLISEILAGKTPSGGLAEISPAAVYTFAHSVDVCILSVWLGLHQGYKKNALHRLGIGSMLHDLGKIKVSPDILNKPSSLTDEEYEEVKKHPVLGYTMLIDDVARYLSDSSLEIVLSHHERYNGGGYPRGLEGDKIGDMVAICALSDVYSAMTTDRVYRRAFPVNEVYEMITALGGINFQHNAIRLLQSSVCPYPVETLVMLSTGQVGLITANNRNLPLRPVVTLLATQERIDLSRELSVIIERTLTPDEAVEAIIQGTLARSGRAVTVIPVSGFRDIIENM